MENGSWEGERGNSKWIPDADYVPQKANPERRTWGEILGQFGIDGIPFENGEPRFDAISKGTVHIDGFTADRDDNFEKADLALSEQIGCDADDIKKWRQENKHTWHERSDMRTMDMVPGVVHSNTTHRGGISKAKG